jgi:hypothetical protein
MTVTIGLIMRTVAPVLPARSGTDAVALRHWISLPMRSTIGLGVA